VVTSGAIEARPIPASKERLVRLERPMLLGTRKRLELKRDIDSPQLVVCKGNKRSRIRLERNRMNFVRLWFDSPQLVVCKGNKCQSIKYFIIRETFL